MCEQGALWQDLDDFYSKLYISPLSSPTYSVVSSSLITSNFSSPSFTSFLYVLLSNTANYHHVIVFSSFHIFHEKPMIQG